jgi:hypothetical protein
MFSRSASPWLMLAQGSSVFAAATLFEEKTIIRRQHFSAEEEDHESSYLPSGCTEPSLSLTTTATSRARSGSQLTPVQALTMAQELLCYQPTVDGHEG